MRFFLAMIPPTVTDQQHRIVARPGKRAQVYDSPELQDARHKLTSHLAAHRPDQPMTGPVRLRTLWCFPLCADHWDGQYRTSRPDTDNLQKMLKDCMTDLGYWRDDAQVASELTEKFWAERPGIFIEANEIPEDKNHRRATE
jgi:Holliday junction resolvase RusA-like endonuclease